VADFQISSNSGRQWATGNFKQVQGRRGLGFYRLTFIVDLNIDSSDATMGDRLIGLVADIVVGGQPAGRAVPLPNQLPILPSNYSLERQLNLELDLNREQIEAIEDLRNGGDLTFNVALHTTLSDPAGQLRQVTPSAAHTVNQSVWLGVLEQMRYSKTLLIEVPVPDAQQSPELAAASMGLVQARQAMSRGDYREAVGVCRDVMDKINSALKDDDNLAEFSNLREKTKADRVRLLRRAVRVFTHPAHHGDDVAGRFEWNRVDAASTISIVAALLNELDAPGAR
jgi:hypothetical protein